MYQNVLKSTLNLSNIYSVCRLISFYSFIFGIIFSKFINSVSLSRNLFSFYKNHFPINLIQPVYSILKYRFRFPYNFLKIKNLFVIYLNKLEKILG